MAPRPGNRSSPAARIAGTFLRAAMGPIEYAGSCILGNKIQTGIEELAPNGLSDSFHRGIADVAKLVGVPRAEVERVVPLQEVAEIEGRLRESHPRALAAWRSHAGQFGFLDVVTALTVDGRRPEIGLCLERVAGKVRQDRALAQPLESLSIDVAAWADVVSRTRQTLEDITWLTAALRRRVLMRAGFASIVLVILFSLTGAIVGIRLARDAAATRVAKVSDCDADKLTESDLKWATREQRDQIKTKIARCASERERAEAERRESEARAAQEKKEREAREARQHECETLAADVERGELSEPAKTTASDAAALLERVAKKSLQAADYGPEDPKMPCADAPDIKKRLESSFGDALVKNPTIWLQKADLAPSVREKVIAKKDAIDKNVLLALASNAERTATIYLTGGNKDVLPKAKHLCALAKDLGTPGRQSCHAVENL